MDVVMLTADGKKSLPNVANPKTNATNHPVAKSSLWMPMPNFKDSAENQIPRETIPNAHLPQELKEDVRQEHVAKCKLSKFGLSQISLY